VRQRILTYVNTLTLFSVDVCIVDRKSKWFLRNYMYCVVTNTVERQACFTAR